MNVQYFDGEIWVERLSAGNSETRKFVNLLIFTIVFYSNYRHSGGTGMTADGVNISAILDSVSASYDKRVRPNYGG